MMCAVPGADDRDYSSLRSIAYGASPITTAALKRSLEVFGAPLFQVYGLTETTGAITELAAGDHDPGGPRQHLLRSAGRPYPWVEMKAVDPVTGQDCGPGEVGEIWTRSRQNSPGYWDKPAETAAAFDADGWLHTGDAGYLDDEGFVFLTDRIKDMIVYRRGERVPDRGRVGALRAPRRRRRGGDRRPRRTLGRDREGGRRTPSGVDARPPTS